MITPQEAAESRRVGNSARFIEHTHHIDELLRGTPNTTFEARAAWKYELPILRDAGAFVREVEAAYSRAGWR